MKIKNVSTIGTLSVMLFLVTGCFSSTIDDGALGTGGNTNSGVDTTSGDAAAGDLLAGKKAWVDGVEITGTATDQGAIDLNTTAIPVSSGGFYSSIALTMSASSVCVGTSIFGSAGTAVCNSVFGDLTASNMHRDVGTTAQMTLTTEKASGTYASGYREVPDVYKDDDGYYTADQGCGGSGGLGDTCSPVVKAGRPTDDCGTGGTITARIADCVIENGALATWAGSAKGLSGEATWKLVTRKSGYETWRDERTGLLWSDFITSDTWCTATGNGQTDGYCDGNTLSYCAESAGLSPASAISSEDWSAGTPSYSDFKGGMGKNSSTSVRWRAPTRNDWLQAEINGVRFVLPNMNNSFWSASVISSYRDDAWFFIGSDGYVSSDSRNNYNGVRCVGR